ncbi:MAG TPA: hypothetical protein PKD95_03735 [Candidatus Paceibacterota bacterium]|nr:hypothetical protein [Candidatus Paceibacterota bacterium]
MFPLFIGIAAVLSASLINSGESYIKLVPSQTAVMKGETFTIKIYASAHVPVNALDLKINFASSMVKVLSVDKGQSVLTIWTQEPKISHNSIELGGGTFRRGFVGEHLVATIKAQANFSGMTEFLVEDAKLLEGDGKGTPVTVAGVGSNAKTSFYIYDQSESPETISANLGITINPDIDGDGKVTLKDISFFMAAWRAEGSLYDFNNDGRMNFIDFSIILARSFVN